MAYRVDIGELSKARRTEDGRLVADARLTRSGVFPYFDANGEVFREYRPPNEVFDDASLRSAQLVPVTDDHPAQFVDASNAKDLSVGSVGDSVRRDGNFVRAPISVNVADTIAKMERGKVELSCGYFADLEHTAGVSPEGEPYDAIQRNIRYNHVAVVDRGRAGPEVRVRMDADTRIQRGVSAPQRTDHTMTLEELSKLYQKSLSDLATAQAELSNQRNRADAAEQARDAAEQARDAADAALKSAEDQRDAEKARADAAEKAREDAVASSESKVRARLDLESKAEAVLGDRYDSKMSDRDMMRECVKTIDGVELSEDSNVHSDVYVQAYYDSAIKRRKANRDSGANARGTTQVIDHGDDDRETAAKLAFQKRSDERFKNSFRRN